MNLFQWFKAKPSQRCRRLPSDEMISVATAANDVHSVAQIVNEKLKQYAESPDPFVAMFTDAYNSQSVDHMTDHLRDRIRRGMQ